MAVKWDKGTTVRNGSPFCLVVKSCFAAGKGEIMLLLSARKSSAYPIASPGREPGHSARLLFLPRTGKPAFGWIKSNNHAAFIERYSIIFQRLGSLVPPAVEFFVRTLTHWNIGQAFMQPARSSQAAARNVVDYSPRRTRWACEPHRSRHSPPSIAPRGSHAGNAYSLFCNVCSKCSLSFSITFSVLTPRDPFTRMRSPAAASFTRMAAASSGEALNVA